MTEPPSKKLKTEDQASKTHSFVNFFHGIKAVIVESGLGKTRAAILGEKLVKYGGHLQTKHDISLHTTHIFVGDTMKYDKMLLGISDQSLLKRVIIAKADWLSKCLLKNELVKIKEYTLLPSTSDTEACIKMERDVHTDRSLNVENEKQDNTAKNTVPNNHGDQCSAKNIISNNPDDQDSDYIDSDNEDDNTVATSKCSPEKGSWICANPSTSRGINHNQHITDKLQVLATSYANTKDQWRALGYKKAISSIQAYHKKISTWEECSSLPFVGEKLAKKIWEIVDTGHLRRLDHIDPKMEAINLFTDVWGAGPKTAEIWVSKGFRTLEDLEKKANLTSQQKIGLKYFEEFRERMPHEEAGKIGEKVKIAVKEVNQGLVCETCGSYRRGKPTCGDVDVLVSHPDGKSHQGVLPDILYKLKDKGFITDDLVSIHSEQNKYMGVCKLPGDSNKHRRLDVIMVPYSEYPCAIMYFTGSDYFNRSMRLLAKRNGMSLSEHSLNTGVVRHDGEKVFEGTPLPVSSEKDIFKYLGLEYRTPEERDW